MTLDLNEIARVCETLETIEGPDVYEMAEFIIARGWLPKLVAELTQAHAERDTLSALIPLYEAVDDYLDYPTGHPDSDRLVALREVFLEMSAGVPPAVDNALE